MLPWLTIYDHTNWETVYLAEMKLREKTAPELC